MNDWPFQDYEILRQLPDGSYWQKWEVQDEINRILLVKKLKYFDELDDGQNRILRQQVEQNIFKLKEVQKEIDLFPKIICSFSDVKSLYWVENYIQGKTLEQKAPLEIDTAISFVCPLTEALIALHNVGLVHRDLQPSNIFLNNLDKPVLINIDIVSDVLFSLNPANVKTLDNPFVAPELKTGNIANSKGDLYSLAYVLAFAIAGKIPDDSTKSQLTGEIDWEAYIPNANFSNYDQLIRLLEKLGNEKPEGRNRTSRQVLDELKAIMPVKDKITTTDSHTIPTKSEEKKPLSPKSKDSGNPTPQTPQTPTPQPAPPREPVPVPPAPGPWKGVLISGLVALVAVLTTIILMQRSQPVSSDSASNGDVKETETLATTTPPPQSSPTSTTPPTSQGNITESEAVSFFENWLRAKREIYAPPFNRDLLREYLTGRALECNFGSVQWLEENGAYYTYDEQQIVSVNEFSSIGDDATISVTFKERRTLYNSRGGIDPNNSGYKTSTTRYELRKVDGNIKISYFKLPGC
ncbi:MAG: IMS domain-containing protein [Snowella sp.]|nr:IMS domain-containing protein [Snowella sp.]